MAKFEVFIPAVGDAGFDLTFRVEAENWLAALNTGLQKIGAKGGAGSNFLVDIQDDNSIHVTDPKTQRVFRITEQAEPAEAPQPAAPNPFDPQPGRATQIDLPTVVAPAATARPGTEPHRPAEARPRTEPELTPLGASASASPTLPGLPGPAVAGAPRNDPTQPNLLAFDAAPGPSPRPPSGAANSARPRSGVNRRPSGIALAVTEVPREATRTPSGKIGRAPEPRPQSNVEEVLAELFERVEAMNRLTSPEEALEFVLDLAMEKIAAESGSIFLADLSTNDLTLGAARGPKSSELLRLNPRVPMGVGIVGFCAQEGVSLAISDAQRDPRFHRAISERIGYPTQTILCAPMLRGGRSFGCLEVLNKKTSTRFTQGEVAILGYLADATARYLESVG